MQRRPEFFAGSGVLFVLLTAAVLATPALAADGYLGVQVQSIDETLAAALDLEAAEGVLISEVIEDSPAAKAGLQRGDLILKVDGREATDARRFTRSVRRSDAGEAVKVEILRKGKPMTIEVTLGEVPESAMYGRLPGAVRSENGDLMWFSDDDLRTEGGPRVFFGGMGGGARLGVNVHGLDAELGRYFGAGAGALVLGLAEDSPAAGAGLATGDVIVGIDDEKVEDATDLHEAIADHEPGDEVTVRYLRDRKEQTVKVELGEDDGLRMVRELRGPHHAPRAPRVPSPPRAPYFDDRDDLELELEALRERLERMEKELEEIDR